MERFVRRAGAAAASFLMAGILSLAADPAGAQSARNREEKAQSKPSRDEKSDKRDRSDDNSSSRNTNIVYYPVSVPVIVGGNSGGGNSSGASAPVFGGARFGKSPRIAFLSDRTGVPGVWMMYENGSDIRRITRGGDQAHDVAFSPERGRIACTISSPGGEAGHILLLNANGRNPKQLSGDPSARQIAWSPDDRFLVYTSDRTGNPEIYLASIDGKTVRRLTEHPARDTDPTFSGDGQSIIFASDRDGKSGLYRLRTDGTGVVERVTPANAPAASSPACTPWNGMIAFVGVDPTDARRSDIYVLNPDTGIVTQLTRETGKNQHPVWDPAGGRIAFSSNRGGTFAIYTISEKGSVARQITFGTHNDTQPSWW